ncbi:hypothetical protein BKA93DRAFT_315321 [Sparassis latifolia]
MASNYMSVGSRRASAGGRPVAHVFCSSCKERHNRRYPDTGSIFCKVVFPDLVFAQYVYKTPLTGRFHCPRCHRAYQDPGCLEEHASLSSACHPPASTSTSHLQLYFPPYITLTSTSKAQERSWRYYNGSTLRYSQTPRSSAVIGTSTVLTGIDLIQQINNLFPNEATTSRKSLDGALDKDSDGSTKDEVDTHRQHATVTQESNIDTEELEVEMDCLRSLSPDLALPDLNDREMSSVPSLQYPDSDDELQENLQSSPSSHHLSLADRTSMDVNVPRGVDLHRSTSSDISLIDPVFLPLHTKETSGENSGARTPVSNDLLLPPVGNSPMSPPMSHMSPVNLSLSTVTGRSGSVDSAHFEGGSLEPYSLPLPMSNQNETACPSTLSINATTDSASSAQSSHATASPSSQLGILGPVYLFLRSLATDLSFLEPAFHSFGCRSGADLDALCAMSEDEWSVLHVHLRTQHGGDLAQWPVLRAGLKSRLSALPGRVGEDRASGSPAPTLPPCIGWSNPICAFLSGLKRPLLRHAALFYAWGLRDVEDLEALYAAKDQWDTVIREELLGRGLTLMQWVVLREGLKARR